MHNGGVSAFNAVYNACLMLFAVLSNAVCLHNAFFLFAIDFCKCFLFSCFVLFY